MRVRFPPLPKGYGLETLKPKRQTRERPFLSCGALSCIQLKAGIDEVQVTAERVSLGTVVRPREQPLVIKIGKTPDRLFSVVGYNKTINSLRR